MYLHHSAHSVLNRRGDDGWMALVTFEVRHARSPPRLADRTSAPETFKLPIHAARLKVREILEQLPQAGYIAVVEMANSFPTPDRIHEAAPAGCRLTTQPKNGATPYHRRSAGAKPEFRGDPMATSSEFR